MCKQVKIVQVKDGVKRRTPRPPLTFKMGASPPPSEEAEFWQKFKFWVKCLSPFIPLDYFWKNAATRVVRRKDPNFDWTGLYSKLNYKRKDSLQWAQMINWLQFGYLVHKSSTGESHQPYCSGRVHFCTNACPRHLFDSKLNLKYSKIDIM